MSDLSSRAMLVSLSISSWAGRRCDKLATEDVAVRNNADRNAVRVGKSLLPTAASLQAVHKYAGVIRTFVYKHTLPWAEGTRILRADAYMSFVAEISKHKSEYQRLVNVFVSEYPLLVTQARASLGLLFNSDDYPDDFKMGDKFAIDVQYLPIPTGDDWRVDLDKGQIDALRKSVEANMRAATNKAMQDAFDRIYSVAENAFERLSDPKAVFRDSLVNNASELCKILPSLNIANDKRIDQLRKKLESTLCKHNPGTLRKDPTVRQKTAQEMKAIMSTMSGFMGSGHAHA